MTQDLQNCLQDKTFIECIIEEIPERMADVLLVVFQFSRLSQVILEIICTDYKYHFFKTHLNITFTETSTCLQMACFTIFSVSVCTRREVKIPKHTLIVKLCLIPEIQDGEGMNIGYTLTIST